MHHRPGRVDAPEMHLHLEPFESIELARERHGLLSAVLGGGLAIGSEAAVFSEAAGRPFGIVTTPGRIGLVQDVFDCGARVHQSPPACNPDAQNALWRAGKQNGPACASPFPTL